MVFPVRLHGPACLKKIDVALQLSERIDLASLEISSFASELDCEEERITQIQIS